VLFNSSAQKILSDAEKLAVQSAAVFSQFLIGKNGEFARVKVLAFTFDVLMFFLNFVSFFIETAFTCFYCFS
jgi:hypothetical protein